MCPIGDKQANIRQLIRQKDNRQCASRQYNKYLYWHAGVIRSSDSDILILAVNRCGKADVEGEDFYTQEKIMRNMLKITNYSEICSI